MENKVKSNPNLTPITYTPKYYTYQKTVCCLHSIYFHICLLPLTCQPSHHLPWECPKENRHFGKILYLQHIGKRKSINFHKHRQLCQGEKLGGAGYGPRLYTSSTREEKVSQQICLKYTKYIDAIASNYKTTFKNLLSLGLRHWS